MFFFNGVVQLAQMFNLMVGGGVRGIGVPFSFIVKLDKVISLRFLLQQNLIDKLIISLMHS